MIDQNIIIEGYMEQGDSPAPKQIYDHLGGKIFMIMIGATKLIEGNRTLSFNVKQNPKDVTHVHIILVLPDLYDVEFHKIIECGTETLSESYNVCPCDLRKIISEGTGLEIQI
jgi:hypothetical protein